MIRGLFAVPGTDARARRSFFNGRGRAWRAAAAAALCGSLMGTTCQTRLHDSVINGTRLLISQILDPSNLLLITADDQT